MLQLATGADFQAVNSLAAQIHREHAYWAPEIYREEMTLYPRERFDACVKERQLYCAKLGTQVVGYALLSFRHIQGPGLHSRKVMHIQEFCVEESCRRQGIGTEMMGDIHALARAFGCDHVQLSVQPENETAIAFYQKCGFSLGSLQLRKRM